jgi:hypothetical protein
MVYSCAFIIFAINQQKYILESISIYVDVIADTFGYAIIDIIEE